jgi:hypothetical protein
MADTAMLTEAGLASGRYSPSVLGPRKRSEHALVAVVQEADVNG